MKKNIISKILIAGLFFICCSNIKVNVPFSEDFNFSEIYKTLKISKKIILVRYQESDYFLANLYTCNPSFYNEKVRKRTYYLKENKVINNIVVTEYIFKNSDFASKSFKIAAEYADFIRKLERKDYSKRCYEIWDEQLYFVTYKNNHIYIFTTLDNLKFDKNNNVEAIINNSKEILLDDFYNEFDSKCKILD